MRDRQSRCHACGKPIIFAIVGNKMGRPPSRMPLDPSPDPAGNVASYRNGTGTRVGRVLGKGGSALGYERLYMPHFATCEKHTQPEPPPGVTSLDEWRKAKPRSRRPHPRTKRRDGTR